MAERFIEATFEDNGDVSIEGHGYQGKECIGKMEPYEQALGLAGAKLEPKPELANPAPKTQQRLKA